MHHNSIIAIFLFWYGTLNQLATTTQEHRIPVCLCHDIDLDVHDISLHSSVICESGDSLQNFEL